jgi:hypothetical protein
LWKSFVYIEAKFKGIVVAFFFMIKSKLGKRIPDADVKELKFNVLDVLVIRA